METLYFVIPCYNEEEMLPITARALIEKMDSLVSGGRISPDSKVMFVDDGSADRTWEIIEKLHASALTQPGAPERSAGRDDDRQEICRHHSYDGCRPPG